MIITKLYTDIVIHFIPAECEPHRGQKLASEYLRIIHEHFIVTIALLHTSHNLDIVKGSCYRLFSMKNVYFLIAHMYILRLGNTHAKSLQAIIRIQTVFRIP